MRELKEYVKAVLYAYPLLKNVDEEYGEYVKTKAVLSYRKNAPTFEIATDIATQIVERDNLLWLKERVEKVLLKLTPSERELVESRYFKPSKKEKTRLVEAGCSWSERKYFRMQNRLGEKLEKRLEKAGVDENTFIRYFATVDIFRMVQRYVARDRRKMEKAGVFNRQN